MSGFIKNKKNKHGTKLLKKYKDLKVISDEDFKVFIDYLQQGRQLDYSLSFSPVIRLPGLKRELEEKLGLPNDCQFIFDDRYWHVSPLRKASENSNQALRVEEYYTIPEVIRNATFVLVRMESKDFEIVFRDQKDNSKINYISFSKTENFTYVVNISKNDALSYLDKSKLNAVGVGVEPTIYDLRACFRNHPSAPLDGITDGLFLNLPQTKKKSSNDEQEALSQKLKSLEDLVFKPVVIEVAGAPRNCANGLLQGFKNAVVLLEKINEELQKSREIISNDKATITKLSKNNDILKRENEILKEQISELKVEKTRKKGLSF